MRIVIMELMFDLDLLSSKYHKLKTIDSDISLTLSKINPKP